MAEKRKGDERAVYRITVEGTLDDRWSDWFSGLAVVAEGGGEGASVTTMTGLMDQAALRGILNKVWDLNLTLVSVVPVKADQSHSSHPELVEG